MVGKTDPDDTRGTSGFSEHRIRRPGETVVENTIGEVADVDERLGELVGRNA